MIFFPLGRSKQCFRSNLQTRHSDAKYVNVCSCFRIISVIFKHLFLSLLPTPLISTILVVPFSIA